MKLRGGLGGLSDGLWNDLYDALFLPGNTMDRYGHGGRTEKGTCTRLCESSGQQQHQKQQHHCNQY